MASNIVAKCILTLTGLCYLGSAIGLFVIGTWVFNTYNHFDELADASLTLLPASIILAVGAFMMILAVLAIVAAFKTNKCLLSVFFCLVLAVLIGEVSAGALGYVYRGKVEGILHDNLINAVDHYNVTVNKDQIDYLQREFHCCGIQNASDWATSTSWQHFNNHTVPSSCCKSVSICKLDSKDIYTKGCLDSLEDEFKDNLIYICVAVGVMAVVQILALICTCILVCRTRDQIPYVAFGEPVGGGLRV